jgi:hypothetical protein
MYEVVQRINATSTVTVDGISITTTGVFALHNTKFLGFEIATSFMNASKACIPLRNFFIMEKVELKIRKKYLRKSLKS